MYRTHTCNQLRLQDVQQEATLSGWVQRVRNFGGMTFIDLRDRYGITQLYFDLDLDAALCEHARALVRESVIQVRGRVRERSSKNPNLPTGDIELVAKSVKVLSPSATPPFTIEDQTDGGEELRLKYRYLDLRRKPSQDALLLRHRMAKAARDFLDANDFIEVETPVLIKSTPEGARDFVVPSRLNPGQFYALPQSPQVFKQLLMVAGYDRYFQIVKCFRDESFRSDRQPEFTQIDCEMSFVEQEDVLNMFEGLAKHLFKQIKNIEYNEPFPRMSFAEAMRLYGNDRPDIRFGMTFVELTQQAKGKGFPVFDAAGLIVGINAKGCGEFTRKQLDELTKFVQRPQVGAKGLVHVKCNADGSFKSSVDKFYSQDDLAAWAKAFEAQPGDLLLVLAGEDAATRKALSELRLEMGNQLGLRPADTFAPLWVVDFPLLEWDAETQRFHAMHHPFTAPKPEDAHLLDTDPGKVRANAYDLVINGSEIGGGSVRIFDSELQAKMFKVLGFSDQQAQEQFGFLMNAFRYGAPPHAGAAFGFDRWVSIFGGYDSIRDVIAFPKNNTGRDLMMDSPSPIAQEQLDELHILFNKLDNK